MRQQNNTFDRIPNGNRILRNNVLRRQKGDRSAFTLVEVMLVLVIILAIAGLAIVAIPNMRESANIRQAQGYVKALSTALELYQVDVGRFPTSDQGLNALLDAPQDLSDPSKWRGPYLKDNAQTHDPWDNPYQYESPGSRSRAGYEVWSFGPDGTNGTDDDIGNFSK